MTLELNEKEINLIKDIIEKLSYGFWGVNESKEYITEIKELKLSEEEFETFLDLLKKILPEEEFEYIKDILGFMIYQSWEL